MSRSGPVDGSPRTVRGELPHGAGRGDPSGPHPASPCGTRQAEPPLYARMHNEIAARIAEREWMPGAAIPPERNLAAAYGVSLGTIRRAIELLVMEGRLKRRQGSGTFVRGSTAGTGDLTRPRT